MAPVTASTVGVARQTIDDAALTSLIARLSKFDPTTTPPVASTSDVAAADGADGGTAGGHEGADGGGDVVMAEAAGDDDDTKTPPLDIGGLVAELEKYPRWRFQEQADLHEWIRPLNAIDAALDWLMEAHPSLLLLPRKKKKKKGTKSSSNGSAKEDDQDGNENGSSKVDKGQGEANDAAVEEAPPETATHQTTVLLSFLATLLRNATSKSLFRSVSHLSSLLSSPSDRIASLAVEALAALAAPPALHRQQAPETGRHATALHDQGENSEVMWRLTCLSGGWGSRGTGLGVRECVGLDDAEVAAAYDVGHDNNNNNNNTEGREEATPATEGGAEDEKKDADHDEKKDGEDAPQKEKERQHAFLRRAGELAFECYIAAPSHNHQTGEEKSAGRGGVVSIHLARADLLLGGGNDDVDPKSPAGKRRRTDDTAATSALPIKSTAVIYRECLARIQTQLHRLHFPPAATPLTTIPPSKLFALLASVRRARAFHASPTRIAAVETRLRALTALVHGLAGHAGAERIAAVFAAQPELVGELADLLRPTVSGSNVSSGALLSDGEDGVGGSSILALSDAPLVPYTVRTLAVEALTALVARRDGSTGSLCGVARQTNVLAELGVGKGQHMGLLPSLIRRSLAALNSFLLHDAGGHKVEGTTPDEETKDEGGRAVTDKTDADLGLELGLAFLRATRPPPPPRTDRVERALEFVDVVLTLTSAVISVPTGTASLTDCGVVPALVSAVALDAQRAARQLEVAQAADEKQRAEYGEEGSEVKDDDKGTSYADVLLKFIAAQAIQILEGAIVTYGGALAAFHELHGVDVLVRRLGVEIEGVQWRSRTKALDRASGEECAEAMNEGRKQPPPPRTIEAARRVLLFSAVNCLTVVFHQHEPGGSNPHAPSGGEQLCRPEVKGVLLEIMDHVDCYGGVLAALVSTFLSDVMNADPQVVHHVHASGLAASFLTLVKGPKAEGDAGPSSGDWDVRPVIEPSAELIMALPNVISALSLTEAGAKAVEEADPFPALLALFCSPQYAMPNSRCLLNEMAAIVGTGLDELMRHTPSLKTVVIKALVRVMERVASLGKDLVSDEDSAIVGEGNDAATDAASAAAANAQDREIRRTQLVQYSHNVSQLLEQILHSDDHVTPFVSAGGFDALLELARWAIVPGGSGLVAQISCLSSSAGATHSSASGTLTTLIKNVMGHTNEPHKLIKKVTSQLDAQLLDHSSCVNAFPTIWSSNRDSQDGIVSDGILDSVPTVALHNLESTPENSQLLRSLSCLIRSTLHVDWLTNCLAGSIRAASQRAAELGAAGLLAGRENEWRKEISSHDFQKLVDRLGMLYRSSMLEVCRVRTADGFDERDMRMRTKKSEESLVYKIRIVCQEGAIVRNGIDIDRCENIGSLEMGEVVCAYDRCINSSGVLRYLTNRGWVSEMTRGHGRENIAEVLDVRLAGSDTLPPIPGGLIESKRVECGVPDLRSAGASVLARLHGSQSALFSSLERIMVSGIRPPPRSATRSSPMGPHILSAAKLLSSNLKANMVYGSHFSEQTDMVDDGDSSSLTSDAAKCMYFGSMCQLLNASLFEEKRDRSVSNVALLLNVLLSEATYHGEVDSKEWKDSVYSAANGAGRSQSDSTPESSEPDENGFLFSALRFVLMHSLGDMAKFAAKERVQILEREEGTDEPDSKSLQVQRMSRAVASSLPPVLSLLRKLMSRQLLVESTMASALVKMDESDFIALVTNSPQSKGSADDSDTNPKFNVAQFVRALHLKLARLSSEVWSDERFSCMPAHAMHPWVSYMGEVVRSLDEAGKVVEPVISSPSERLSMSGGGVRSLQDPTSRSGRILASMGQLGGTLRELAAAQQRNEEPFEPSEESISRLAEMGFTRDHALEALETVGTNRIEVAMEYALTHPPSSPGTLERRRAAREQRRLERQQQNEERERQERESSTNEEQQNQEDEPANESEEAQAPSDSKPSPDTNEEESKPKSTTEEELKVQEAKELETKLAAEAKEYCETMKKSLRKICFDVVEANSGAEAVEETAEDHSRREGVSQGIIVVVSNFLLDIIIRHFPTSADDIATELLERIKGKLDVPNPNHCRVKSGCDCSFASLVHVAIVLFRSLPKSRPLLLRHGLVGMMTHCVRNCTLASALRGGKDASGHQSMVWPRWLAPVLLMLEVMAQPTTVTPESDETGQSKRSELGKVISEHKKKTSALAKTAKSVFSTMMGKEAGKATPKKKKGTDSKKHGSEKADRENSDDTPGPGGEGSKQKSSAPPSPLPPIPTYLPLMPEASSDACMMLCLQLLGLKSKKGLIDKAHLEKVSPPPLTANAALVLLLRVLHSRQNASSCLTHGGADLILALPSRSLDFPAKSALITLLLRRMLEDEATLLTMTESEIRSLVAKCYKRQHPNSGGSGHPKTNLKSFMQACTPLICRDPAIFLKAMASCVKIEATGSESSSLSSSRGSQVILLSNEERVKVRGLLGTLLPSNDPPPTDRRGSQEESPKREGRGHRTPKQTHTKLNGTPANHVTSLLLKEIVLSAESLNPKEPFLSTIDYLGTLSDLVLAIPACGAAVHRFKLAKGFIIHNAISGSPDPPQTAVSYLLHKLLPQPRLAPNQEDESGKNEEISKSQRVLAHNKTMTSQAAARLLVCLVARSGEGRRRVISDLVFALSCGECLADQTQDQSSPNDDSALELDEYSAMHAFLSWAELCMGLSAPRSSASVTSQESNSALSFDVVKLMLESGAAHALMAAIAKIRLNHPMASTVTSALVKPLEMFTRGAVYKTVTDMAEKDKDKAKNRRMTFGPSQRNESSFADDAVLDHSFDIQGEEDMQDASGEDDDGSNESMEGESDSSHSPIDVPPMDIDGLSDEEIESEDSSGEESSDDMEEESDGHESVDEEDGEDMSNGSEEEGGEAEGDWGDIDNDDFFDGNAEDDANALERPRGDEAEAIEGWTRIDAGGRGGILGGLLDMVGQPQGGTERQANGGFLLDAAETIMGSVLRGDLGMEGIDAVEDALGIRVVRNDGRGGSHGLAGHLNRSPASSIGNTGRPAVHQGGGATFGTRGILEVSPMEFVYGESAGNQLGDFPSPLDEDDAGDETYATQLFPGGVTASTHNSRSQPSLHPLCQSIRLPPITSLWSSVLAHGDGSSRERTTRSVAASGTYSIGANGNIIRVNGSDRVARRASPGALGGWMDDSVTDRGAEAFSTAFGSFLQEQSQDYSLRRRETTSNEENVNEGRTSNNDEDEHVADDDAGNDEPPDEEDAGAVEAEEDDGDADNDEAGDDELADGENEHNGDASASHDEPPPAQESQPEEEDGDNDEAALETDNEGAQSTGDAAAVEAPPAGEDGEPDSANDAQDDVADAAVEGDGAGDDQGTSDDAIMADAEDVEVDADESAQAIAEGGAVEHLGIEEAPARSEEEDPGEDAGEHEHAEADNQEGNNEPNGQEENASGNDQLVCPPDIDPEVFASLPLEMQQEVVQQHQDATQISESGLDPEALAALPEDMRREIIEQEQQQQRLREQEAAQPAADPANAEDMDNASFLASLAPDLRQEILLTADEAFISSLPDALIAEANVLRERVAAQHRRRSEEAAANAAGLGAAGTRHGGAAGARQAQPSEGNAGASRGRRQRNGILKVEADRDEILYTPERVEKLGPLLTPKSAKALLSLFYLLSPIQPTRVQHKLMLNLCLCKKSRDFFLDTIISLLLSDSRKVRALLSGLNDVDPLHQDADQPGFPPSSLIGVTADLTLEDDNSRIGAGSRRRQGASAVTVAACLPASAQGSSNEGTGITIPPVVSRRLLSLLSSLCKSSPRIAFSMLCRSEEDAVQHVSCLDNLLDLIESEQFSQSATNLEQLLGVLEMVVAPLSLLPKDDSEPSDELQASGGREAVRVPRVELSKRRLHLLVNILRLESCKDSSFLKVNTLTRRLSRVEANRECILQELAIVAGQLGKAATRDLKAVSVRLRSAAKHHRGRQAEVSDPASKSSSSAVALATSNSELKLLRVLQMLNSLCAQDDEARGEGNPPEFNLLLQSLHLDDFFDQLSLCLKAAAQLEGVAISAEDEEADGDDKDDEAADGKEGKKLQTSSSQLITRFLPAIEAFFMVNAPSGADESTSEDNSRFVQFAGSNKIMLNALLRSNPHLLEKGLRAMVKTPKCRLFLDFDVKRHWFKAQVRKMRQQASRRHGSFRLNLRRKHVFEDSFHAFIHRNADELRGRLHITFINEEGVDAGGLSREFFAILAKEMFNPNYALFMSTEDGCTFQPNPNSAINPDDLRYFRFVGRIVGKAVVDGFLLDAHFTRSLYKHMLGEKPKVDDMQAIDPDYFKNLQMILEHNLEDIGLELTFSTEDHSFGRSRTIDLIPDGRKIPVTEETKQRYVDLVCQHRMTTAIEKQIKAYLEGFHEMVSSDLISIFTAKELELLISGMPDIDIHDLKKNTDYNGYRPADKEIGWFWNILFSLTKSQKASFLQFVTGSSKVPLAGFGELQGMRGVQKFSINKASGPVGALMSAHTCFNALDLPVYKSEEEMKEKLMYAIQEGSGGFGFA